MILTTETRGGMVENVHCGTVCVVSERGVEYSCGLCLQLFVTAQAKNIALTRKNTATVLRRLTAPIGLPFWHLALMQGK